MATKLDEEEIAARLGRLSGWQRSGDSITRQFSLKNFPSALVFVSAVGLLAEQANHHPDIDIRWRNVRLTLTTHDAGGLTDRDFDLASRIDGLVA
jgi:4a-hydroxytetrahydrobiopterin dehydratase